MKEIIVHNLDYLIGQNRQLVKTLMAKLGDYTRGGQRWIEFQCPYCDDQGNHLGINLRTMSVRCLRCEARPEVTELLKLKSSYKPVSTPIKPTEAAAVEHSQGLFSCTSWNKLLVPFKPYSAISGRSKVMVFAHEYLTERKIDVSLLDQIGYRYVGLVHTDRLRGRIVFVSTVGGRPAYYQARAIPKICVSKRKTLNPAPDEGWLDKGHVLFGYDWIKPETKTIILVEGLLDALRSTSIGFRIVGIPLLGKVMSAMQLLKLREFEDRKFVVALDRDAEIEAISAALQLYEYGLRTYLTIWPKSTERKDPADYPDFLELLPRFIVEIGEDVTPVQLQTSLIELKERRRRSQQRRIRRRL